LDYEIFVDQGTDELLKVLEKEPTIDFAWWMLLYSMDVSSRMLFSESLGFLESGSDVGGTIQVIRDRFTHWGNWSSLPMLERLVFRNLWSLNMKRTPSGMAAFAFSKLRARMVASTPPPQRDILQKFIEASQTHPDTLDTPGIIGLLMFTISGAGDTTATTMAATIYFLLKNPAVLNKLLAELSASDTSDRPMYSETSKLHYLNAVIRESMRCFPSATWPIERKVPVGGVTLHGMHLPEGTSVGCQPSVVHQDRSVFGEHTERFIPERWLNKSDDELRRMDRAHLGFGKGKRLCLGQHIAVMQIKKLVPMLVIKFKVVRARQFSNC
jgi:cytochrome P450